MLYPCAMISRDFEILAANQAYRDRFNRGERVCGKKCFEVSHRLALPCREAGESCPIERAAESRSRARALHVHKTSKGDEQHMISIHPLLDPGDQIMAFLEILSPVRVATARLRQGDQQGLIGQSAAFNRSFKEIN